MGADQREVRSTAPGLEISSVTRAITARQAHSYSEWHAMAWTDQSHHPAHYITAAAQLMCHAAQHEKFHPPNLELSETYTNALSLLKQSHCSMCAN